MMSATRVFLLVIVSVCAAHRSDSEKVFSMVQRIARDMGIVMEDVRMLTAEFNSMRTAQERMNIRLDSLEERLIQSNSELKNDLQQKIDMINVTEQCTGNDEMESRRKVMEENFRSLELHTIRVDRGATIKGAASQVALWPLDERFQGRNVLESEDSVTTISLTGVDFSSHHGSWPVNPARFYKSPANSYGRISGGVESSTGSFSWIGMVNRLSNGYGPLFMWWNAENEYRTYIWIYSNRLIMNVKGSGCSDGDLSHSQNIQNNRQYVMAATYDAATQQVRLIVDGKEEIKQTTCERGAETGNTVTINKYLSIAIATLDVELTCFSLFNEALTYEELHRHSIELCRQL